MGKLDVGTPSVPKAEIQTKDQALAWLLELVEDMLCWRQKCDVLVPGEADVQVKIQDRSFWTYLTKQGQVVGAATAFLKLGIISERAFNEINQQAINTLVPSNVGRV